MNLELMLALIELSRLALEAAELYGKGEITEAELHERRKVLRATLDETNRAWEAAGR